MKKLQLTPGLRAAAFTLIGLLSALPLFAQNPHFSHQTIDSIEIGYGLAIGDVNGDGKPDILLADKKDIVWYRNPDWQRFVMVSNLTERDNVCIAARDINGDGRVEVAVGAQWNPAETSDSTKSGSVHYLIRPDDPTQLWEPIALPHEPTTHRMGWVRVDKDRYDLVVVPLHGRDNKNGEGAGVRIYAYEMPANPRDAWTLHLIHEEMHMTHNFDVQETATGGRIEWGGKEGALRTEVKQGIWPEAGKGMPYAQDKGFGEIRWGKLGKQRFVAGIRPMHGEELMFTFPDKAKPDPRILATDLAQGHALACADLLGAGRDQIVAGWRNENADGKVGIRMYIPDKKGKIWNMYTIDDNEMACEDLKVADLDGDGKPEIIAAGRATKNLKIYWNLTK